MKTIIHEPPPVKKTYDIVGLTEEEYNFIAWLTTFGGAVDRSRCARVRLLNKLNAPDKYNWNIDSLFND